MRVTSRGVGQREELASGRVRLRLKIGDLAIWLVCGSVWSLLEWDCFIFRVLNNLMQCISLIVRAKSVFFLFWMCL